MHCVFCCWWCSICYEYSVLYIDNTKHFFWIKVPGRILTSLNCMFISILIFICQFCCIGVLWYRTWPVIKFSVFKTCFVKRSVFFFFLLVFVFHYFRKDLIFRYALFKMIISIASFMSFICQFLCIGCMVSSWFFGFLNLICKVLYLFPFFFCFAGNCLQFF